MQQPDLFHAPDPAHLAPRARATDPATSHDAARAFRGKPCRNHYLLILGALWRPMVPPEIGKLTGLSVVQIDRRRRELVDRGAIRLTGRVVDGFEQWERVNCE